MKSHRSVATLVSCAAMALVVACESDKGIPPEPEPVADLIQLSAAQEKSLDSIGTIIKQANPGNAQLQSLIDSTLQVLNAGVTAKRVAITTNLTTAPLYFVGVHRAVSHASGSFSTWTLVGFDSPSNLKSLVEVSGFAQGPTTSPPVLVTGTIGSGFVNGRLMQVGANGSVTTFIASGGSALFSSLSPGAACPGTMPPNVTCVLETMRVSFTLVSASKTASQETEVDVPAMRLTYTIP